MSNWKYIEINGHDSTILTAVMAVVKHELLFRILNRGLFSLWANCAHDLAVYTQALSAFFILDYFAATWKRIAI